MADTTTTNIVLTKPEIAGSVDTWGAKWNANADVLDDEIAQRLKKVGDALTGPLGIAPGSTTAPGLYVTGDADTGINSSAPNTLDIVTGGVNRVEVSDTSVTIKTTTTTITGAAVLNGTLAVDGNVRLGDSSTDTLTVHPNAVAWQAATTTHAGSHTLTGNLQVNGNTTLGDAAADTLTVNPSAVSWPGNPTHGGNHTFSGNVSVQGNTTIGNAAADTLTVHPSAVAWQNAVTHANNHTFSGNVSIEGNTTLGNASTDTLTVHPAAVAWQQTTTTHANNHTFSGNVSIEGNTTVGNAAADTLTVHPNAVAWQNAVTHSNNHTFSGNVALNGNTTLGDASGDTVTLNGSLSVAAGVAGTARSALGTVADPGANGVMVRTAANTTTARNIAVSGVGLSITNETGVAGDPTISSNATSGNTGGAIVARDPSGDFSARIISADLSGTASNSNTLGGVSRTNIFNNTGNSHSTYQDFNALGDFGYRYVQNSTNGPGIAGAQQYYNVNTGLGADYPYSGAGSYAMQMAIPRTPLGGSPYISVRFNENGSFGAWSKIFSGFSDNAGALGGLDNSRYNQSARGTFTAGNWNTLTAHGVYKIQHDNFNNDQNPPPAAYAYGILEVDVSEIGGENRINQRYIPHVNDNFFYQRMNNGGDTNQWTPWNKTYRGGDVVTSINGQSGAITLSDSGTGYSFGTVPYPFKLGNIQFQGYWTTDAAAGFCFHFIKDGRLYGIGDLTNVSVGVNPVHNVRYGVHDYFAPTGDLRDSGRTAVMFAKTHRGNIWCVMDNGDVWSFGADNRFGQRGTGVAVGTADYRYTRIYAAPGGSSGKVYVSGANGYVDTGAFVLVNQADGTLYYAGRNDQGAAGLNNTTNVPTLTNIGKIAGQNWYFAHTNGFTTWAVTDAASGYKLYASGRNSRGELGDNTTTQRNTFGAVIDTNNAHLTNVKYVKSANVGDGGATAFALTHNGNLYAWGMNDHGLIGNNTRTNQTRAFLVMSNVVDVHMTYNTQHGGYAIALMTDGSVRTWGRNINGVLGTGDATDRLTPTIPSGLTVGSCTAVWASGQVRDTQRMYVKRTNGRIHLAGETNYGCFPNLAPNTSFNTFVDTGLPLGIEEVVAMGVSDNTNFDVKTTAFLINENGRNVIFAGGYHNSGMCGRSFERADYLSFIVNIGRGYF